MKTAAILLIYIAGIVPTYVFFRWMTKSEEGTWTKSDRRFFLRSSFLSWIAFFFAVMYFLFEFLPKRHEDPNNDSAEW